MMTIYEKIRKVQDIAEEVKTIRQTLEAIKFIGATVNVRTTNRCLMIADQLEARADALWEEFQMLNKDIEKFKRENGL